MSDSVMVRHGIEYRVVVRGGVRRYVSMGGNLLATVVQQSDGMWAVVVAYGDESHEGAAGTLDGAFRMARSFVDGGFNG